MFKHERTEAASIRCRCRSVLPDSERRLAASCADQKGFQVGERVSFR
jgi:hypothetical protein